MVVIGRNQMAEVIAFPQETAIIGDVIAGAASVIKEKLEVLINSLERSKFDIAELLYEIKDKKYYVGYGFDTAEEYFSTLMQKQRAKYLVRIVDVMGQCGCGRDEYEKLGIAKLREITSLDPTANYKDKDGKLIPMRDFIIGFVDEGDKMSLKEIQEHVKTLKGLTGEDELVWVNLHMKRLVKETTWTQAIEKARVNIGAVARDPETGDAIMASDSRCAEVIAIEYLNNPVNDPIQGAVDATNVDAVAEELDKVIDGVEV